MAVEWFCHVMGSEVGPLNRDQLVQMVRTHQINPEDLVRRRESGWVPAFQVKGLFAAAARPPVEPDPAANVARPIDAVSEKRSDPKYPNSDRRSDKPHTTGGQLGNATEAAAEVSEKDDFRGDWFCIATGEKHGPMSFAELQRLAQDGSLRRRDRVWRGSSPKWRQAGDLIEFN